MALGHLTTSPLRRSHRFLIASLTLTLSLACTDDPGSDTDDADEPGDTGSDEDTNDSLDGDTDGDTGSDTSAADHDSCAYASPFTGGPECRDYVGTAWTEADVDADCSQLSGEVSRGQACDGDGTLGRCIIDGGSDWEMQVVIYGSDDSTCDAQELGCETFAGGSWEPSSTCGGGGGGGGGNGNVFVQPYLDCRDPIDGEPPGQSEGGQVCTWQAISASTEENRHFQDYGSCDVIYTQRPYYGTPPAPAPAEPDPRLDDPSYVAELDWVRSQVEASACVCCHSEAIAPTGPSNWYIEAPGNWIDSFYDSGLALGAGWVDSTSFGAFPPEDNNGFDRIHSGIPSTDPTRMVAFFVAELEHRGRGPEDFTDTAAFGGPLYQQLIYEPGPCENGEGVAADGTINWTGGPARYLYVLAAGSDNPTVPPNLDLPDGTLWRVDVPWEDGEPIASGEVSYGQTPAGLSQRYPAAGAPTDLVPGQTYYLYVTKDVGIPITRCLFNY